MNQVTKSTTKPLLDMNVLHAINRIGANGRLVFANGVYFVGQGESKIPVAADTVTKMLTDKIIESVSGGYAGAYALTELGKKHLGKGL